MALQHLKCKKRFLMNGNDICWEVIVEETDPIALAPKRWRIHDITHHDTELLADDWLRNQWNVISPPVGDELEFVLNLD